ncbi:hypothetical protein ZWY2020_057367 [Hordeum vulgare]|nr:hypothetical protein ZWY2020_057367 [Hordeum vulgare]
MAYAVPPGEDDGLLSVLELALADRRHPLPAWVSKDDLYRDLPQTIAANCFQSTDGAGRPAWYVLTPLRAIGGRTRRTVYGAGYWKVERTTAIFLSQGGEPSSPKPAPDGSCVKLSFILRPHNGPEGRNGWLMKQYLLTKAPGNRSFRSRELPTSNATNTEFPELGSTGTKTGPFCSNQWLCDHRVAKEYDNAGCRMEEDLPGSETLAKMTKKRLALSPHNRTKTPFWAAS